MSIAQLRGLLDNRSAQLEIVDVHEQQAFEQAYIPFAINIPRGRLEFRVNELLLNSTQRMLLFRYFSLSWLSRLQS